MLALKPVNKTVKFVRGLVLQSTDVICLVPEEDGMFESVENFIETVKVVVPEGMVVGVRPDNHQGVRWTYKVTFLSFLFIPFFPRKPGNYKIPYT